MTAGAVLGWVADGFILFGAAVMTIGVIGIFRMPGIYMKLHAASKSVFLGVCAILVGVLETGDPEIIARAVLIGLLLVLTTPVAAYEIARAAALEQSANEDVPSPRLANPDAKGSLGSETAPVFASRR